VKRRGRTARLGVALVAAVVLVGCATPAERVAELAQARGFERRVLAGAEFDHVVFFNHKPATNGVLHVYIEGDGTPYLDRWTVAPDPTPRHPVMLPLMALDTAAAVFVGRPCYFGLAREAPCTTIDWTTGRFSERVVASMASVFERVLADGGYERAEIFGHRGGGALAVLLARRLPHVAAVLTLGGNLDTDRWCDLHRYSRLEQSMNPARLGALPGAVRQRHFVGMGDDVTPPWLVDAGARAIGAPGAQVLPGVTHTKGWDAHWPAILAGQ